MRIKEFSEKYGVSKREVLYWTTCGWIRCNQESNNNYYDYREEAEEDIRKILIVRAMGARPIDEYIKLLDILPKDLWKTVVFDKINGEIERLTKSHRAALEYAAQLMEAE